MTKKSRIIVMTAAAVIVLVLLLVFLLKGCGAQTSKALAPEPTKTTIDIIEENNDIIKPEENQDGSEEKIVQDSQEKADSTRTNQLLFIEIQANEDVSVIINANGDDSDKDSLKIASITEPAHGTLQDNGDGTYTYVPNRNYHGNDEFEYIYIDENGEEVKVKVDILVGPINDAPRAKEDTFSTDEDIPLVIGKASLLSNDKDVDSKLKVTKTTDPEHGKLTDNGNNTYTYVPNADYTGEDSFKYTVSDGYKTDTATVTITVEPVNDAPVAQNDSYLTDEDNSIVISTLLINDSDIDGDSLSIVSITNAGHGTLTNNGNNTYVYTPNANFFGSDSFTYTVSDGKVTDTVVVIIKVNSIGDTPSAVDDEFSTDEDNSIVISNLLGNDSDADGDPISIVSMTGVSHGTLTDSGNNTYTYVPELNYNGEDSFTYTISDGIDTDTAIATITVAPVNDAPVAKKDYVLVNKDTPLTFNKAQLLSNDSDLDGDTLEIISFTQTSHGTLVDNGASFTYTPNAGFDAGDSFTYTMSDGTATDAALVSIWINTAPVAVNDSFTVIQTYGAKSIDTWDLFDNDTDFDGDDLSIESYTLPSHGTLEFDEWDFGTGIFIYTPDEGYLGTDSFTYTVTDGMATDTATVSLMVVLPNTVPVAVNDTITTSWTATYFYNIDVLGNDSDLDGDTLEIISINNGWVGTVYDQGVEILLDAGNGFSDGIVINDGDKLRYKPAYLTYGYDVVIYYTVSDGKGGRATGRLNIKRPPA